MSLAYLNIMKKAAEKAAFSIVRDFGEIEKLQISKKGLHDFVTSADTMAEQKILSILQKYYPKSSFISEEAGKQINENSNLTWIIDPIDGTTNFMRGIPYFTISISLQISQKTVASIVLDPIRGECFSAEVGNGAYSNRARLRVSSKEHLTESVIAIHCPLEKLSKNVINSAVIRHMGSVTLDLAYLAAGKYDAVICDNVNIWDIVHGILMVVEAGGFVTYNENDNHTFNLLAASSRKLLQSLQ